MIFRPSRSFFSNSSKDVLSEIDLSIIRPKNLTGLEWMEGIKDVKSDGSLGDETEKGVVFIYLPLMLTMLLDLSALKVKPAHFRDIVQRESKVFAAQIAEDIIFRSSMKTLIGSIEILFRWNCGVIATNEYSRIIFIPAKKSIIDRVQPVKILHWCICQLLAGS